VPISFDGDLLPPVILRHSVNLLAGAAGTGKTAFLAMLIARIAKHEPIFTLPIPPERPVYQAFLSADRSWRASTSKWFDLQGITLPHYSLQDDKEFKKARLRRKQDRIAIFAESLERLLPPGSPAGAPFPDATLIYVDPLTLFLGGNLLDYDTCLVSCSELREICQARNVTIIGTAHAAKQKAEKSERYLRLQDRILGSAALYGYTDTQLYLASPEETGRPHYTFLWAPHHAPTALFSVARGEDGLFTPGVEVAEAATPGAPDVATPSGPKPLPEDVGWILAFLQEPRTMATIAEEAEKHEMSRATVVRRLGALREASKVQRDRHGVYVVAKPH